MFSVSSPYAFIIRALHFSLLFVSFPLLFHYVRTFVGILIFGKGELPFLKYFLVNLSLLLVHLAFALFFPNIGTILSYVGAFAGFFMIYFLPVATLLKK